MNVRPSSRGRQTSCASLRLLAAALTSLVCTLPSPAQEANAPAATQASVARTQPAPTQAASTQPAATQPAATQPAPDPVAAEQRAVAALEHELEQMLNPANLPLGDQRRQLVDVAARSGRLARSLVAPQSQLRARSIEMQAYNALAQEAMQENRPGEASLRVAQLRTTARQVHELPAQDARPIAAFWMLQADLMDLNRNEPSLGSRQLQAMARLESFLDEAPAEGELAHAARLALLRLAVQAGDVAQVRKLLPHLATQVAPDDPDAASIDAARRLLTAVGRPAGWLPASVALEAGQVLLLEMVGPDAAQPPTALREAVQLWRDRGLRVVTVGVGPVNDGAVERPWPAVVVADADAAPLRAYDVRSLPRYVLIGPDGRVAALAHTPAIIARIPELLPDPQRRTPAENPTGEGADSAEVQ